jgi:hypothetical protein
MVALSRSEDALNHLKDLPCTASQIDLPGRGYEELYFVYLSGDRLYTAAEETLYVYSMSDHTYPIATYLLGEECYSGIITDNHLYLVGKKWLYVFRVTSSINQPLIAIKMIKTKDWVLKIFRNGNSFILGGTDGYLEVFDIKTSSITHTHKFTEGWSINDIIAIDETHYLLATLRGLLKTT